MLAPIVLFVYNRPEHTRKTIKALLRNELASSSELFVFSDGPKNNESISKIEEVRNFIEKVKGFKELHLVKREKNLGLAASVIQGITEVLNNYERVIVLEDDLVTSPSFLSYMNKALDLYEEENKVISVHGYIYPIKLNTSNKTVFLKGADCWGWGTWKRGWELFENDGQKLLIQLKDLNLIKEFNFNNSFPFLQMLEGQIKGSNNSWAIRWYASAFLKNKYTLYPTQSLVKNIGLDSSGTHSGDDTHYSISKISQEKFEQLEKIDVVENEQVRIAFEDFFRKSAEEELKKKVPKIASSKFLNIKSMSRIKKYIPKIFFEIKNKALSLQKEPSLPKYGWFGDYISWEEAKKASVGYQDDEILNKVKTAILKVKNGEAAFERDSVNFDKIQYSWPISAALFWIAAQNFGVLNIVDFGGSLGSSYFQNRKFLRYLKKVNWNVIEQQKFTKIGKELLQNDELKFFDNVEECYTHTEPEAVLFSSVLQYIESPYSLLDKFFEKKIKFILVDLTGFTSNNEPSKITVQKVDPIIYDASYPSWIFNKEEFIRVFIQNSYELVEDFESEITINYMGKSSKYNGFIFKRKNVTKY